MDMAMPDKVSREAKRYSRLKYILAIADTAYLFAVVFLFQVLGLSRVLALKVSGLTVNPYLIVTAYLLIAYLIYSILDLPLTLYRSFMVERKFGLTNQKLGDWFKDQVKAWTISYLILAILFCSFYYVLRSYPHNWWLVVSIAWIFFSLVLAKLVPVVIIPIFFKYKPLSDAGLRDRIRDLASKSKVEILDVFEIDLSKKTLKANAAFVGWGATKRVILADTLKDKYSHDEIEVILAHEFAHYKLKHLIKLIAVNAAGTLVSFYVIFRSSGYFLSIFGVSGLSDIAGFPVIVMYLMILGVIMQPLANFISRRFERDADMMALEVTGAKGAFISMMEKLSLQNLADRNPHPLVKFFFFDHPPIDERIASVK